MKTQKISIRFERMLVVEPDQSTLSAGDMAQFHNDADSTAVLQFESEALFGEKLYEIKAGTILPLSVQRDVPSATYFYRVKLEGNPRPGSPCIIVN